MNRLFITAFLLSSLSGCATDRNAHFIAPVPVELGSSLAADAIKQLQTLYPPAQTKFNLGQPVPKMDSFGTSLVFEMRQKGYAIQEVSPVEPAEPLSGLSLTYAVDRPASNLIAGLYRVQLRVGKAILTRAYTDKNNTATPAGAWAKME
jgi:hypothetical protein